MVNNLPDIKTNTYVDMSTKPRRRWDLLNKGSIRNVRNTKPAQGKWQLNMIIGPFTKKLDAKEVMEFWRNKSRGMISRRKRGIALAKQHGVKCWDIVLDMEQQEKIANSLAITNAGDLHENNYNNDNF